MRRAGALIAVLSLTVGAATAYAASTRAEYVAQVDPICQSASAPVASAFSSFFKKVRHKKGGRQALKHPEVVSEQVRGPASQLYGRLGSIYAAATAQIAAVAPAPEDAARVSAWLSLRGAVAADLQGQSRALKNKRLHVFDHLLIQGEADSRAANDSVRDFGFQFCTPAGGSIVTL